MQFAQSDFSAGMFFGSDPAKIPSSGALDIVGLLSEDGSVIRRGGSEFFSAASVADVVGIWEGELATGHRTVLFTASDVRLLNDDGTTSVLAGTVPLARPAAYNGKLYWQGADYNGTAVGAGASSSVANHFAVVAGRLIRAREDLGNVLIEFSGIGTTVFGGTDSHSLPGVGLRGIYPLRDALVVFTTQNVVIISGLSNELTDPDGNVLQRIDLYSDDIVLRGSSWGIAGFEGGLIVPGEDGIWTVSLGITSEAPLPLQRISQPIDRFWRTVGYNGEQACVHHGHYLIPVTSVHDSAEVEQVLACRLDARSARGGRSFPWSRLHGDGAAVAMVAPRGEDLIGGSSGRLLNLRWFSPSVTSDASGATVDVVVTTRDFPLGARESTVTKLRVDYIVEGGTGQITAELGKTAPNPMVDDFDIEEIGDPLDALAGAGDETLEQKTWPTRAKGRFVRARITGTGPRVSIRGVQFVVRQSGAQ